MAKRKEEQNLPLHMENDTEPSSTITYANEVIAIIAGLAASEVEGVAGMVNVNSGLKGKNRNVTRGVKVEVGTEEVSVDLYLNVEYGTPIQRAAHNAQESVKKNIESMTGLHVVRVDVHVLGVSFEKENRLQAGAGKAVLESGEESDRPAFPKEEKKAPLPEQPESAAQVNPEPAAAPEENPAGKTEETAEAEAAPETTEPSAEEAAEAFAEEAAEAVSEAEAAAETVAEEAAEAVSEAEAVAETVAEEAAEAVSEAEAAAETVAEEAAEAVSEAGETAEAAAEAAAEEADSAPGAETETDRVPKAGNKRKSKRMGKA